MSFGSSAARFALISLLSLILTSCFHPPFNNFQEDKRTLRYTAFSTAAGAGVGAVIGTVAGNTVAGAAIGGVAGALMAFKYTTMPPLIKELQKQDIQFIQYGDTMTLIVPTDRYFQFNSPRLDEICYAGLNNIVRLLKRYPCSPIFVAGFTDDVHLS